ncbi:glycosyltransferase family 2 protein [Tunicatimonas pelagia]|uniref:glycosyltransferase family 2 protein n=1 Tax=Tunicatimonas pelagia TaxID=931531 RepID=UPI0026662C78|nr:glycosyltransferase [Tunicatimonas pelagia]WKN45148.1 glycosyltransferase [Tunicatimonas pelagia]
MPPKVSVSIITYNHEKYIAQAIDSVLKQRVTFHYEIIIGDDCSSDGTRQILQAYQQKYPDVIQLVLHPHRYQGVPGRLNNITNLYACRGQYVALLDGDDYWISEDKLQQQVDFLDKNHNYALAFHDAKITFDNNSREEYRFSNRLDYLHQNGTFTQEDLLSKGWFIPTSSVMYRNSYFDEFPDWFWDVMSADTALHLLLSQHGNIYYACQVYSVYRQHNQSFISLYYHNTEISRSKINDLRIFRAKFLTPNSKRNFFQYLVLNYRIERRIAHYKHSVLHKLKREKQYVSMLRFSLKVISFSFCIFYLLLYVGKLKRFASRIYDGLFSRSALVRS